MNPLILFDYVYYRIANIYDKRFGYVESKEFAGVGLLSLVQTVNILSLFIFIKLEDSLIKSFSMYIIIIVYVVICALNYTRYIKLLSFSDLEDKWGCESNIKSITRGVLVIVYFLLSFYLLAP